MLFGILERGHRMEVQLSPDQHLRLSHLAAARGCDEQMLVREAVDRMLDYDEWFSREVDLGLAEADREEFLEHSEVRRMIDSRYPARWCEFVGLEPQLRTFGVPQARRAAIAIDNCVDSLRDMPHMGRLGRKPGTRELPITGLPFIVIYRDRRDAVEIV